MFLQLFFVITLPEAMPKFFNFLYRQAIEKNPQFFTLISSNFFFFSNVIYTAVFSQHDAGGYAKISKILHAIYIYLMQSYPVTKAASSKQFDPKQADDPQIVYVPAMLTLVSHN